MNDSTTELIASWIEVLDTAVNWSTSSDYRIFFHHDIRVIGVGLSAGNSDIELLQAGAALGLIKSEVVQSELCFENLWFAIEDTVSNVI